MQKRVIVFREFFEGDTGDIIFKLFFLILNEYDFVNKGFAIDFDNTVNNIASISQLQN